MKLLITGGAGFIGYHLCDEMVKENQVTIYDNINNYYNVKLKEKNLADLKKNGVNFIKGDILDAQKLLDSIKNYNCVIHLAAQPGVRYSSKFPLITNNINLNGTLNVLEAIRKNPEIKLIFSSSSSVFGDLGKKSINENLPRNPLSIYGISKYACEEYVKHYEKFYDLNIVSIRPFTVSGERQRPDMALFKFIDLMYNDREIIIFGDGNQTRDWGNVKNIIAAFKKCAELEDLKGQFFNIGNGKSFSVLELINLISKYLNKEPKLKFVEKSSIEPYHTLADISKAKTLLNYIPKFSFEDAIESEISFYLNNLDLFK